LSYYYSAYEHWAVAQYQLR